MSMTKRDILLLKSAIDRQAGISLLGAIVFSPILALLSTVIYSYFDPLPDTFILTFIVAGASLCVALFSALILSERADKRSKLRKGIKGKSCFDTMCDELDL